MSTIMMKHNIHRIDRLIRVMVGIIFMIISLKIYREDFSLGLIFGLLSLYLFVTTIIGVCPIYMFLEVNTKTDKNRNRFY